MSSRVLEKLYDKQYLHGEWSGSRWYKRLKDFIKTREEVVASLVPPQTISLLDVGCGEGALLSLLANRVTHLHGTDLLPRRIAIAKKLLTASQNKNIVLDVQNVDDGLSFKDESFNVVTCVSVLEYVLDPHETIKELKRVIKKNGTLILEVPNLAYVLERLRLLSGNLVGVANAEGWQGGRLHHFTFSSLVQLLTENGFDVVKKSNSGLFHSWRQLWAPLLASDIIIVAKKK